MEAHLAPRHSSSSGGPLRATEDEEGLPARAALYIDTNCRPGGGRTHERTRTLSAVCCLAVTGGSWICTLAAHSSMRTSALMTPFAGSSHLEKLSSNSSKAQVCVTQGLTSTLPASIIAMA